MNSPDKMQNELQGPLCCLELKGSKAHPFVKWAGGKKRLLSMLRKATPATFYRYYEPFLGGGASFFDLCPPLAYLSDTNAELIHCYETVRDFPDQLIEELSGYRVNATAFYKLRSARPAGLPRIRRAARFIYLNKTCYNGIYRVNKQGDFNTPFGHYKSVALFDEINMRRASTALKQAVLKTQDYQNALESAAEGDFVYLDPPYLPISKYSDFKRYTKESFYESDHEQLARTFRGLTEKGCFVLLSNSYHDKIAELYSEFHQITVQVPRFVNCKGEGRGKIAELLISNYKISPGGEPV